MNDVAVPVLEYGHMGAMASPSDFFLDTRDQNMI